MVSRPASRSPRSAPDLRAGCARSRGVRRWSTAVVAPRRRMPCRPRPRRGRARARPASARLRRPQAQREALAVGLDAPRREPSTSAQHPRGGVGQQGGQQAGVGAPLGGAVEGGRGRGERSAEFRWGTAHACHPRAAAHGIRWAAWTAAPSPSPPWPAPPSPVSTRRASRPCRALSRASSSTSPSSRTPSTAAGWCARRAPRRPGRRWTSRSRCSGCSPAGCRSRCRRPKGFVAPQGGRPRRRLPLPARAEPRLLRPARPGPGWRPSSAAPSRRCTTPTTSSSTRPGCRPTTPTPTAPAGSSELDRAAATGHVPTAPAGPVGDGPRGRLAVAVRPHRRPTATSPATRCWPCSTTTATPPPAGSGP